MRQLPDGYIEYKTIDLSKPRNMLPRNWGFSRKFRYLVNVLMPLLFCILLLVVIYLYRVIHDDFGWWTGPLSIKGIARYAWFWGVMIAAVIITLIVHGLTHALVLWGVSGERPRFGVNMFYTYAIAPGWYFPRDQYLLYTLAPLALVSPVTFLAIPVFPLFFFSSFVFNVSAASGDVLFALWLLGHPRSALLFESEKETEFKTFIPRGT